MDKDRLWAKMQRHMGYTDEQITQMRNNPRYRKMVEETPEFMTHKIVVEVIKSEGCHAQHRVGDRFVLDANGYLLTAEAPKKICLMALAPVERVIPAIYERLIEKLPLDGFSYRLQCTDIGADNGGWGQILMKVTVVGPDVSDRRVTD